jgi:L-idonate 5-dehydrogenase
MRVLSILAKERLRLAEAPLPEPGAGEVRIRVAYVGICGSDLHYYFDGGIEGAPVVEPLTPGHELSATVDLDPAGMWTPGTPVTVHPATLGTPIQVLADKPHLWPNGAYLAARGRCRTPRARPPTT